MKALRTKHPHLQPLYPRSVYAATSTNFGPNVMSFEHEDFGNKANGVCPIFSFGWFDHMHGSHLVLRQLKLIIEFSPGSLIILPSATLTHGNTPIDIAKGEYRLSFTQHTAGGLFWWVSYGFHTWDDLWDNHWALANKELKLWKTRWQKVVDAFSKIDQLHKDRVAVGLVRMNVSGVA